MLHSACATSSCCTRLIYNTQDNQLPAFNNPQTAVPEIFPKIKRNKNILGICLTNDVQQHFAAATAKNKKGEK